MSLIIALGSNLGNKQQNLAEAKRFLNANFSFIAESRIYSSDPVDYLDQDVFLNQVLEYEVPKDKTPLETLSQLKSIETKMGSQKLIYKGPRIIDLDIIFWELKNIKLNELTVPHESWNKRSFVVKPLSELPYFKTIEKNFDIPQKFDSKAEPLEN